MYPLATHLPLQIVGIAPIVASTPQEAALLRPTRLPELIDLPISHYIRAEFFLKLLQIKQIRLGRLDAQINDPTDGCLPKANLAPPSGLNGQFYSWFPTKRDPQIHDEQHRIERQLSYIHCWFKGHEESAQMWKDFGSAGTGVCIQSTTKLLMSSVRLGWPHDLIFQMHECPYTDSTVQVPEFLSNIASVRKDSRFEDQQEIRILAQVDVTLGAVTLPGPDCKVVPVDLNVLLGSLVLGPMMTPKHEQAIRETLIKEGLKIELARSSI